MIELANKFIKGAKSDMTHYKLSDGEKFWYFVICVLTLGGLYFTKVAVKKAIVELNTELSKPNGRKDVIELR